MHYGLTQRFKSALSALILCGSFSHASAQNSFFTSGTHTIDAAHSVVDDALVGIDSSFNSTDSMGNPFNATVNLVTGGTVGGFMSVANSSVVNINGGTIHTALFASNSSIINLNSGSIGTTAKLFDNAFMKVNGGTIGGEVTTDTNSTFIVSGGILSSDVTSEGSSNIEISGGSISNFIDVVGTSHATISGGTFSGGIFGGTLFVFQQGKVLVTGGAFSSFLEDKTSSTVTIKGGSFGQEEGVNYLVDGSGGLILVGTGLTANLIGPDSNFGGVDFALSGRLQDGTNLEGYVVDVVGNSPLTLLSVPEPSALISCGALVTGSILSLLRRKHL